MERKEQRRAVKALNSAIEEFESQFKAEVEDVNEDEFDEENGKVILTKECEIDGLISSDIPRGMIFIETDGYFYYEGSSKKDERITCMLTISINDKPIGNYEYLLGNYELQNKKWTFRWGSS